MRVSDIRRRPFAAMIAIALALGAAPATHCLAAEAAAPAKAEAKAPEPVTTADPQISLDDLDLLLAPMAEDELAVEAKGWFDLVRAKEREISVAELNVKRKNREIALLEKQKAAAADLAQATKAAGGAGAEGADAAAAKRVAEAQQNLAKTVAAADKETAKDAAKADAANTAIAKSADASSTAAPAPAADAKEVLDKAAAAAAKKADDAGGDAKAEDKAAEKADKVAAVAAKESSASEDVKALTQATAAAPAVASASATPAVAIEAAKDTSQKAETLAKKVDEAAAAKTDVKVQLVDYSTQLRTESTALVDRLKLVLDKWEAKGGDPKTYRLYISSLGGLKIDVSDKTATFARLSGWLSSDEGGLRWAREIGVFLAYVVGSMVVAWIVRRILNRLMSRSRMTSQLLHNFVITASGRAIVAVGVLLGLSALEVNLAPLLAVIGAAGFVVAFALQGTLSNFASGLLIMVFKPFDVNDEVDVGGGVKGRVTNVNIFSTYIHTEDGLEKIVPNDNIWKNVIVNQTTGVVQQPTVKEAHADKEAHAETAEPAA